jgi:hypothetical protein
MDMATTTHKEPAMNTTFEIGKTYYAHSACDYDTIFAYTVIKRTAKFITIDSGYDTRRVGVRRNNDGIEICLPQGSFSMAPVLRANRELEEVAA